MSIEILRFDNYIGFYDTVKKKRLPSLKPNKMVKYKAKGTAFEKGYRYMEIGDIHYELKNKRYITFEQYQKLSRKYKGVD